MGGPEHGGECREQRLRVRSQAMVFGPVVEVGVLRVGPEPIADFRQRVVQRLLGDEHQQQVFRVGTHAAGHPGPLARGGEVVEPDVIGEIRGLKLVEDEDGAGAFGIGAGLGHGPVEGIGCRLDRAQRAVVELHTACGDAASARSAE
ncbi:MAG: hypothetical protein LKM39_06510 [Chiayiivirga sp.]|jgi:hypothetical protein|nr:hypothetical protein [Chiayiivirga sp.]